MSVTISKSGADTYFDPRTHIRAGIWEAFSANMRAAAVAQSIRIISRALGSSVESETIDADDYYYPDRACYEQALYSLVNSEVVANGEGSGPKFINSAGEDRPRRADMPLIAEEAKNWLGWGIGKGVVTFSRG